MKKYLIVAKESEDGLWAQFTMNEPLGPKEVKIYENIDEIALKNPNSNLIGIGMIVNNYIHVKRLINFNE